MPRRIEFTLPALQMLSDITDAKGVEYCRIVANIAKLSARELNYNTVTVIHLRLVANMVKELKGG